MLCEFLHVEKCISACGYTQGAVYFRMCKFTILCDFPHVEKCISACKFTKVQWITAWGDTQFNVNSLMRKSVLPHADIHKKMWISQDKEIH